MYSQNNQINHIILDVIQQVFQPNSHLADLLEWTVYKCSTIANKKPFISEVLNFWNYENIFAKKATNLQIKHTTIGWLEKKQINSLLKHGLKAHEWEMRKMNDEDYSFIHETVQNYVQNFLDLNEYIHELSKK